jgi:hypothetical protein
MRRRLRSGLLRLPGGLGYQLAGSLRLRENRALPAAPPPENGAGTAPLTVELEDAGRHKRLRVRASGDIWSQEFREELAQDRRFEASLVWREIVILAFIGVVLVLRTIAG